MDYLLIGNGPSALAKPVGSLIDSFPGMVVRFNNYRTNGQERFVGSRTDVWATVAEYPAKAYIHKCRWWLQLAEDASNEAVRQRVAAVRPAHAWRSSAVSSGYMNPSSGFSLCAWLKSQGHDVVLWGFDFLNDQRPHHWADKAQRGLWHDHWREWLYFGEALLSADIDYLGWDREKEGFPIIRTPVVCGTDKNLAELREPTQMGWYEFFINRLPAGSSVLDVGAGTCTGVGLLQSRGFQAKGVEWDERLAGSHPDLKIVKDLSEIPDKSVDFVFCMDVLEHVIEDLVFFRHLKRIARKAVMLTTPNGHRSACLNGAHCREYTIPLFVNVFHPDKVWSGSPDGRLHLTRLLDRFDMWYVNRGEEGPDNKLRPSVYSAFHGRLPLCTRFNMTVDGEEWPHIAAEFDV